MKTGTRSSPGCRTRMCVSVFALLLAAGCSAQQFVARADAGLPNAPGFQLQQENAGVVSGTVADARGGLVPAASVTLEEKSNGHVWSKATNGEGRFEFNGLSAGSYTVLIVAHDLKTYLSTPFALEAGQHFELPEVAMAVASETSVEVSAQSTEVAEEELRVEDKQRILGVIPNFYTSFIYDAAPLDAKQKFKLTLHSVTDPVSFAGDAVVAGIEQYRDTFPSWGNDDAASYGKRFAAAFGDDLLSRSFSYAVYPSIFHQDPRYFYMGPANKLSRRFWHAALSGVITRGDNGRDQVNYSHLAGSATAGALSHFYHPASDSAAYLALVNMSVGIAGHGVQALIREFVWPRFTTHVPPYAKGKEMGPENPGASTP